MCVQEPEVLFLDGERCETRTAPLISFFAAELSGGYPFSHNRTSNYRGHVGTWEISEGRLWLRDLVGRMFGGGDATIGDIFPGQDAPIFACWYSGEVIVPRGRVVSWLPVFGEVHEQELVLTFRDGVLTGSEIRRGRYMPEDSLLS